MTHLAKFARFISYVKVLIDPSLFNTVIAKIDHIKILFYNFKSKGYCKKGMDDN